MTLSDKCGEEPWTCNTHTGELPWVCPSATGQMILYNTDHLSESRLTAAALAVLLQQLSLRTDTVVRSWSAHTLVLTAVLHCVTQVHVCKSTVNKHILHINYSCTDTYKYKLVMNLTAYIYTTTIHLGTSDASCWIKRSCLTYFWITGFSSVTRWCF